MPRKPKETAPQKLKGYCPPYIKHMYSDQKYATVLNLNDWVYLCTAKEKLPAYCMGTVLAVYKSQMKEISAEEFMQDESLPAEEA